MTKLEAIATAKQFRKDADELLQRMKGHQLNVSLKVYEAENHVEVNRHIVLSIQGLEDCIMRQGMVLKYIGNPDPYPESRNPESPVVEPTADGLKL